MNRSRTRFTVTFAIAFSLVCSLIVALAACTGAASSAGGMTVANAWSRPSTGTAGSIAVYFDLQNGTGADDALVKVSTPVGTASLHESMAGDSGMMAMQPVDRIAVAKGATTKLEPGGYHVMVENLTQAVTAGSTLQLTLTFEHAPAQTVSATVKAQ